MGRRLPPLNAVVALEATLRQQSVRRAAAELRVTPAAVSQHVKHMEALYGVELLLRRSNGIALTQAGAQLLPGLSRALDELDEAAAPLNASQHVVRLTLSLLPSLARGWLLPRLGDLRHAHPNIDLTVRTDRRLVDFDKEEVDLAVRYSEDPPAGYHAVKLFGEQVFPVCSPTLLYDAGPIGGLHDLRRLPLLHDEGAGPRQSVLRWSTWFEHSDSGPRLDASALRFNDASVLMDAALLGLGVALGREPLVAEQLRRGLLVKPVAESRASERAYFAICPKRHVRKPAVRTLLDWLVAQAR